MRHATLLSIAGILALATAAIAGAQTPFGPDATTSTTSTVTGVTGTISQLNYGNDGSVGGFLIGTTTLLLFPSNVSGGIGTLGAVGNSVTYSGSAVTTSAGFESVEVSSFTNNTTKSTYTSTTKTTSTTAYGPISGTVKQLNYSPDGSIDSFVFTPSSGTTSLLVVTSPGASATLKPILLAGVTVSVTGTEQAIAPTSACVASGVLTVVQASSLIVGGQTIVITSGGPGPFGGGGHH